MNKHKAYKELRRKISGILVFLSITLISNISVYAKVGEIGFFGGTAEGTRLMKTTEQLLASASTKKNNTTGPLVYKEIVFLSGKPVEVQGLLTITRSGTISDKLDVGTYTETYDIKPQTRTNNNLPTITRNIQFTVNYRKIPDKNQIILDYTTKKWKETIVVDGKTYELDPDQSHCDKSIIQVDAAGAVYTKGNTSQTLVYYNEATTEGEGGGDTVTEVTRQETSGTIYGCQTQWSSTETQRLDVQIYNESSTPWQLQVQIRPTLVTNKTLQYSKNEPTAISFDGNYYESMQNQAGIAYDIFVLPKQFQGTVPLSGSTSIKPYNTLEQLPVPELSTLKGHYAEADIKKLFSMQILSGDVNSFKPEQGMSRASFVTALVKALKLPIEQATRPVGSAKKAPAVENLYTDVDSTRNDYYYIKAAAKANIVVGVDGGKFKPNEYVSKQEAVTMLVRSLGLDKLYSYMPFTKFADDSSINDWAKGSIYSASLIGIVSADSNGRFYPKLYLTNAQCAAILNAFIDYCRTDLPKDYSDKIVNFAF